MVVRFAGIELRATRAWLIAQLCCAAGFSVLAYLTVLGHVGARLSAAGCVWVGLVLVLALNFSVVAHEAGHALAARLAGVRVQAVLLLAYGGATVRDPSLNPAVDRLTAAAGPLANLVCAGVGVCILRQLDPAGAAAAALSVATAFQLLNGLVNLLPIARCDGARIFG